MEILKPLPHASATHNLFPETQVTIQNGTEAKLRVTFNNDDKGVVEVEFHELYEKPFRYPLDRN